MKIYRRKTAGGEADLGLIGLRVPGDKQITAIKTVFLIKTFHYGAAKLVSLPAVMGNAEIK